MIDDAFGGGDLSGFGDARAEHRGALELRAGDLRVYDQSSIHCRIHPWNFDLALIVHLDFDDRRDVSQKALMRRDTQTRAFAELAFSPAGFLRHHLGDAAQATGLPRIGIERSSIIWVVHILEIDRARLSNQVEQIIEGIASRCMRELIGKGLHREGVINIGHRAQPADAHVGLGRPILHAKIGNVEGHVGPALLQVAWVSIDCIDVKDRSDRRKDRSLEPS